MAQAARIGPVLTAVEVRGQGYAKAAVHTVAADLLASGLRPCLFTDIVNEVSNRAYAAIGFEPVVEMADHVLA